MKVRKDIAEMKFQKKSLIEKELNKKRTDNDKAETNQKLKELLDWIRLIDKSDFNALKDKEISKEFIYSAGRSGLFGMKIPNEFNGLDISISETAKIIQQLASINITIAAFTILQHSCSHLILKQANPEIKQEYLPKISAGKVIGCFALSELSAGSNPRNMESILIKNDDDSWILNGSKCWLGGASIADVFIVFAKYQSVDESGISCFVIPASASGVEVGEEQNYLGVRGLDLRTVTFNNVIVQNTQRLGELGKGMQVAASGLLLGRTLASSLTIGVMKRCAQLMYGFASQRQISTGLLINNPVTELQLSWLTHAITSVTAISDQACEDFDHGVFVPASLCIAAKILGSEFAWKATDNLVQLMGARGLDERNVASSLLRDSRFLRIAEGPTETLLMEIGSILSTKDEEDEFYFVEKLGAKEIWSKLYLSINEITRLCETKEKGLESAYYYSGRIGIWAILHACVEHRHPSAQDTIIEWIKDNYNQELTIIKNDLNRTKPGSQIDYLFEKINNYGLELDFQNEAITENINNTTFFSPNRWVNNKESRFTNRVDKTYNDNKKNEAPLISIIKDTLLPSEFTLKKNITKILLDEKIKNKINRVAKLNKKSAIEIILTSVSVLLARISNQESISILVFNVKEHSTYFLTYQYKPNDSIESNLVTLTGKVKQWSTPNEAIIDVIDTSKNDSPLMSLTTTTVCFCIGLPMQYKELDGIDVCIALEEKNTEQSINWIHSTAFRQDTIKRRANNLIELINSIETPNLPVANLSIIPDDEKEEIRKYSSIKSTTESRNKTLPELFYQCLELNPRGTALVGLNENLTYQQLEEKTNQIVAIMQQAGVKARDVVCLCMGRTTNFIASLLAIAKMGATFVVLNVRHPVERNRAIIANTRCSVILIERLLADIAKEFGEYVIEIDSELKYGNLPSISLGNQTTPDSIAYISFTSGSTGEPKGVMVNHGALCLQLENRRSILNLCKSDRLLYSAAPNFDVAIWELFGAFPAGCALILNGDNQFNWDPKEAINTIIHYGVTHLQVPPTQLGLLINEKDIEKCSSLTCIITGGELLPSNVRESIHSKIKVNLYHFYGPTEAVIDTSYWQCQIDEQQSSTYIGFPCPHRQIYILDQNMQQVPIGVPGEMYIAGKPLANGYLSKPKMTESLFIRNPFTEEEDKDSFMYKSGDKARFISGGGLEFLGRIDQQIKINGIRVEPGEIENVLESHTSIMQLRVALRNLGQDKVSQFLVAYYVPFEGSTVDKNELRKFAKKRLPKEMVPSLFVELKALPLTSTGKLDIRALPEISDLHKIEAQEIDLSSTIGKVRYIWQEVLGRSVNDENVDFFEIGGHSLTAVKVLTQLRETVSTDIKMSDFLENSTVQGLARIIEEKGTNIHVGKPIPTSREGTIPLSGTQENLWYLYKLNPYSAAYNCPEAFRLSGKICLSSLEKALNDIFKRHESLRTTFYELNGIPYQKIVPISEFKLDVRYFNNISEQQFSEEFEKIVDKEAARPFNLEKDCLFRFLFISNHDKSVIFWNFHHIIADGTSSANLFTNELNQLYNYYLRGENVSLPDIEIQPIDYMRWYNTFMSEPRHSEKLNFWRNMLDGAPAEVDITLGNDFVNNISDKGCRFYFQFSEEIVAKLDEFSKNNGLTQFEIMIAAFSVLIYVVSGEDDFTIGTVVAGRHHSAIENSIGNFANVVVTRHNGFKQTTILNYLESTRNKLTNIFEHSDIPFDEVVSAICPNRKKNKNPLFNIFFSLYNGKINHVNIGNKTPQEISLNTGNSLFDLSLNLFSNIGSINGYIEYKVDLFDKETVNRLFRYYIKALNYILTNPDHRVDYIEIVDNEERNTLVKYWNNVRGPVATDKTLYEIFEEQVKLYPDNIAVKFEDNYLTYEELNKRANRLAHYLNNYGVNPTDLVGLCVQPSIEMFVGLLGIVKAGAGYVPLDPALPATRIDFIVKNSDSVVILTQSTLVKTVAHCGIDLILLDKENPSVNEYKETNPSHSIPADSILYMIFTSGSTGIPKGVQTQHYNVAALVCNTNHMECDKEDIFAKVNNFAFDISTWEIWAPLLHGASITVVPDNIKLIPQEFSAFIKQQKITMLYLPTALYHTIATELPESFGGLKLLVVGGEALDPTKARCVLESQTPPKGFINAYGPTEVTCSSAWFNVKELNKCAKRVPIGKPITNTQFYVLNNEQRVLPIGAKGELYIGGAGVSKGYRKRPELTEHHFLKNKLGSDIRFDKLYRTGDIVRYLSDGNLEFMGRTDHQVKIRGFRIEIGEIENVLRKHPFIKSAIVLAQEESPGNKRLVAFIEFHEGHKNTSVNTIRKYLSEKIPAYMVPSIIKDLNALPLNNNGKVDRNKLNQIEIEWGNDCGGLYYPRDHVELSLCLIWEEVVGLKKPTLDINFFESGGDSLRAVRLISEINKTFGKNLPLDILYDGGNIESLALKIKSNDIDNEKRILIPLVKNKSNNKPVFIIHPLSGSAMCYIPLATMLDNPVYAFQSPLLYKQWGHESINTVETLASLYIDEMLKIQEQGPFVLGGWSFGGIIAFEMARQLELSGHEVSKLFLFDSAAPSKAHKELNMVKVLGLCLEEIVEQFGAHIDIDLESMNQLTHKEILDVVLNTIKEHGGFAPDADVTMLERMIDTCLANSRMSSKYTAGTVNTDTILFLAKDRSHMEEMLVFPNEVKERCLGWNQHISGNLMIEDIDGHHMSIMFQPNVNAISGVINKCMENSH
ncbi:amino acid adenylation domain-containing protein [Xenorhabdus sp. M]|uniref:Amino acid adenylation domain-containing protein n=1 Tax=Xenorhabdus szentirmaii TaxID=290112 RepID=A0AAW3YWI1_9GAMM|nr:non-ribosomal peptide synthetase [Xenorhabdus sp. M]MBD2801867.1 amino acid adenylation domain-containing protein [Xenorhabdus sp. M]